jgi:hypothetical protein
MHRMKTRIMYIEDKSGGLIGPVREEYWRDIRRQPERIRERAA